MTLFIDGDAFVNLLKPIVFRAIVKYKLNTIVVSNKKIDIGQSSLINYIITGSSIDEADNKIIELLNENDLVITADIPLADRVITKKAYAIDHRGELYTEDNIKSHLAFRNLMQSIRDSGEITKGPKPYSQKDAHNFATYFDQFVTKNRNF